MDLTQITYRNYNATRQRGLITDDTTKYNFVMKMFEEVAELHAATSFEHINQELSDVVLVCFAMAQHYKIDLIKEMELKMKLNERRAQR